ncbi:MAG TPA: hypothetical protein VLB86_08260 [Gaiellaceae bacterium]|nr:hypothetical protein [Gaiellaceae bacterium]
MKTLAAVLACALAALLASGAAGAAEYGVTEDLGKASPDWILETVADLGMTRNVVSLTFDPAYPKVLPQADEIDRLVAAAPDHGVEIAFAVYQRRASSLTSVVNLAAFSTWLQLAARRWPTVKTWIGPNEPNQPRFWQPQFTARCANASARSYLRAQATMYDALKSVSADVEVVGVALSPRGNDLCKARSNVSTSPVRFLRALGLAMRASRRNRPIMDALSQHPYPLLNTDAPTKGYRWPNIGMPNLDRLKQAFWDAFARTRQPTFEDGLEVHLDELGWQTDAWGEGYDGFENVPVIDELTQGRYYSQAVRMAACDPSVASLSLFHLVDERDRERFQSGLLRSDGIAKDSFAAVKAAIASVRERGCPGATVRWRHATGVVGARATWSARSRAFTVTAEEDATYTAAWVPVGVSRRQIVRLLAAASAPREGIRGTVRAYRSPVVRLRPARRAGTYVSAIRLAAATNPARTTVLLGKPLRVR